MSETTDLIGAVGAGLGAIAVVWSWINAGSVKAADAKATAAQTAADAAKVKAGEAIAEATRAIAKAEAAQTKAQVGTLELQLRTSLSSRRDKIDGVTRELEGIRAGRDHDKLTPDEVAHMKDVKVRFLAANEDFLNALEQACRHFRDGKVDIDAFRLMYDDEVRYVCEQKEGGAFYPVMHPKETSKFRAVWAVYGQWFDLEAQKKSAD